MTSKQFKENQKHWDARHNSAMSSPGPIESPFVKILSALGELAKNSESSGYKIGEDGYSSDYWADIAKGLTGLLSTETGRLDGGKMHSAILKLAKDNNVDQIEQ